YLAEGQSRRVKEIEQAIGAYRNLMPKDFDADSGIQLSALIRLESEAGVERAFLLGPDAAGLKIQADGMDILVITPRSPMGQNLIGKVLGETVTVGSGPQAETFEIVEIF